MLFNVLLRYFWRNYSNVSNVHEITLLNGFCSLLYPNTPSWQRAG